MPIKAMEDSARRGTYDELYTPYEALKYLIPYLPNGIIWESAPGTGALVRMLENRWFKVISEDRDFFAWEPKKWDYMVTNPPFSLKARWLERANFLGKPYAILLPVTTLGSRNCQLQLTNCDILFLPRRIDFTGKGAPWFSVAWYTKGLLPERILFVNELH